MGNLFYLDFKGLVLPSKKGKVILRLTLFLTYASLSLAESMASLIFHGNCTMCHVETKTVSAPSIIEVKKHYMSAFSKKEDFIKYMSEFALHPSAELSIMQHSVKKHGLMPELGYEIETLREITEYIYDTDFEKVHSGHK
jgi:cytochrome c551/c552